MKFVIIGAGPTGLGAAWRLKELGHDAFLVLERNSYVGGLAASFYDPLGYTWDFAVHVAHSHYYYVDHLMETVLPGGFLTHERRSWVHTSNTFIPFPFQYNFRHLPETERQECLEGLLTRPPRSASGPGHFLEWILQSMGAGIARHFMVPYNTKLWTVAPEEMNCKWLGDRVPDIDLDRVRTNIQNGTDDVAWGPNHVFHFPRTGGTGRIWSSMAGMIGMDHIRLGATVTRVDPRSKIVHLDTGETCAYDHLISTMPVDRLVSISNLSRLSAPAKALRHSRVQVVCLGLPRPLPVALHDKTWIYCPDSTDVYYRITPFSLFSPSHTPDPAHYCSFLCEVATPDIGTMHRPQELGDRVIRDLNQSGLLRCSPEEVHLFHLHAEHGYPIPTLNRDDALGALLPALEEMQIWSRGRFGAWKYEVGNMDHCIMQGVETVNRILLNQSEETIANPSQVNAGKR